MTARHVGPGRSWPLGVTLDEDGANVAVWSAGATSVDFCLFDGDTEERIALSHCDGEIWHAHVAGVRAGDRYGLRADGPHRPSEGQRFHPAKLLIDPYARAIDRPLRWDRLMSCPEDDPEVAAADSAPVMARSIVTGPASGPDPAANRPHHAMADLVVYEAHVKGLTATHPDIPEDVRGTYAAMAHPVVVDHLTALGVTAVELLPVQAFFDDQFLVQKGLSNYWGYQPIAWHAPEPRYAHADADTEMRHLVHTLHEAGIEVIVDVVYNHTGEGDERGPVLSHRGLHNRGYYRLSDHGRRYVDDTGTGNTIAADRPMVLRLILDSLRHWVRHYGVDGFRFDLATTVGRTRRGFNPAGAFFQAVRQDPDLAGVKLIAEPWDLGPGGYQLGAFPHPWSEWNDRFRDGVRRVWRGDSFGEVDLGSRLLGSAGTFDHGGRPATASVNFIAAHDGFTLADLVSFADKHNEANGEDNRDGHDDNHSDNLGAEGPTDDEAIVTARDRRARAMLATLLVSQGVPMLLAGDEFGNSQGGNNNAYAQDNEIGWLDWSRVDESRVDLVRRLIDLRRRLPVLRQRAFLHGGARADGAADVAWLRPDGSAPSADDWNDPAWRCVTVVLRGAAGDPFGESLADVVLLVLNTGGDCEVTLPDRSWRVELDTARTSPPDPGPTYPALAQSVVVLAGTTDSPAQ